MKPLEISTQLTGGKLSVAQRQRIAKYLEGLQDSFVYITISTSKKPKSHGQRGYYWGVILPVIANSTGYTVKESHEEMKKMFLTVEHPEFGTKTLSTEGLTAKETAHYYEEIRRYWLTQGVVIPDPNTVEEVPVENI